MSGLVTADVTAALAELAANRDRVYYDGVAADAHNSGGGLDLYADLVARSNPRRPAYKSARELYLWVELRPAGWLRGLYTAHQREPEAPIRPSPRS